MQPKFDKPIQLVHKAQTRPYALVKGKLGTH